MLRIVVCLCILIFISGCDKNWQGLLVKKRLYRDGYYVHLPWKRYTPKNEYPKPQPYPVDHSRNASSDSTQKYAGGVPSDSARTRPQVATNPGGRISPGGTGSTAPSPVNQSGVGRPQAGAGTPTAMRDSIPQAGSPSSPPPNLPASPSLQPSSPPVAYAPPPPLTPETIDDPPLPRPPVAGSDSILPDTSVAQNDSITNDTVAGNTGYHFPEGEFSLFAEAGFYNPATQQGIAVNPQSYNVGGGARYTIHPWSRHKISAEAGAFLSNISIDQKQHRQWPLSTEPHDKERIMQWKFRMMLTDHIYVTRNSAAKVDAIELGFFSELGFLSTHVAINNSGSDKDAMFTRDKMRQFGLKYLRRAQVGFTIRVANDHWSVFAKYRFNTLIKSADPHGGDLPKVVVGVTRSFLQ